MVRCGTVVGLLAFASLASAQTLRGVVVEGADSVRVPGVVMLLLDATGQVTARTLTNERGEYWFGSTAPGTYQVRTLRIGFRTVLSPPIELRPLEQAERVFALTSVPVALDTVRVARRGTCFTLMDSAGTIAAVWEQARTALTAAQLTARTRTIRAFTLRYRRTLDASAKRTLQQSYAMESTFVTTPWRSISADSLRRFGYVQALAGGWTSYHAPDLDVLLSTAFVEDHCFRLASSSTDQALLGIAFEPTRDRSSVADIRGTLWLDRATSELRRMEFRYANVSRAHEQSDAGGDMEFVRMRNGAWAISKWDIRMPVFEQRQRPSDGMPGSSPTVELKLIELMISGGKLSLAMQGSDTLFVDASDEIQAHIAIAPNVRYAGAANPARSDSTSRSKPPVTLDSVTVTAARPMLSEFEERRAAKMGHFLTRLDLAKDEARALPDILAQLPGLDIARDGGRAWVVSGRGAVVTSLRAPRPARPARDGASDDSRRACYADVYVNGVHMYQGKEGEVLFDVSTMSPAMVEGIEFYASAAQTPVKYSRGGAPCGTLLIWTRH